MSHRIALRLTAVEGALLRVLGTVERRGFRVLACTVRGEDDAYAAELDVDGTRDPRVLCRQLARLLDVRTVELADDAVPERRQGVG